MSQRTKVVYLEGYLSDAREGPGVLREPVRRTRTSGAEVAISLSDSFCIERHYDLVAELAKEANVVFASETEAQLLSGKQVVRLLSNLGRTAVVTLGAQGSIALPEKRRHDTEALAIGQLVD